MSASQENMCEGERGRLEQNGGSCFNRKLRGEGGGKFEERAP